VDLSIIVLVWRDADLLPGCLAAIAAARGNLALEVIVVENGVTLNPVPVPRDLNRSDVKVLYNAQNRGVAPARNQGFDAAQGRYVMLLDTDTKVLPGSLETLVAFMDAHPEVGLAGPRLEDAVGNLQLTCRRLPTVWSKILRRIPTRWAQAALAEELLAGYDHQTPRDVDYCIGACQVIRHAALTQVGQLDEQFFYGPEDVDYCIRMWRGGWRVMYVPQAVVVHAEQRLTKRRVLSGLTVIHMLSLARFFLKWHYAWTRPQLQVRG
jgi:GT2 family glycosyltransferase